MADQAYKEFSCGGGIFCRQSRPEGMAAGELILGHRHNFSHPTFCTHGALEVCLLNVSKVDAQGNPLDAVVDFTCVLRAGDEVNWVLILAGRWHTLRALESGTRYQCIYGARLPTAISPDQPGSTDYPLVKVDEKGVVWYRADERIVDTSSWVEARR